MHFAPSRSVALDCFLLRVHTTITTTTSPRTYPSLEAFQHFVHISMSLFSLILNLLLEIGDCLLEIFNLLLMQLGEVIQLLLKALNTGKEERREGVR